MAVLEDPTATLSDNCHNSTNAQLAYILSSQAVGCKCMPSCQSVQVSAQLAAKLSYEQHHSCTYAQTGLRP